MKKFLALFGLLVLVTACETPEINTSQPFTVNLIGVDNAYCIISTKFNRYALYAPGDLRIERSKEPLKIDCTGTASRRRVVTLEPTFAEFYYRYPESVTVDFSLMDHGDRYNGFRATSAVTPKIIAPVITENSFSAPVESTQTYPVPRTHVMGRRSYPVTLH